MVLLESPPKLVLESLLLPDSRLCLLLPLELLLVEHKLITLEDVTIGAAALSRAGADGGEETTTCELVGDHWVELLSGVAGGLLALDMVADLLDGFLLAVVLDLLGQVHTILLQVPLPERLTVDLDNGILQQGLGSDQLVAGSIVDDIEDTNLFGAVLGAPCIVTALQPQSTILHVATTSSHNANSLCSELGHGRRSSHLELPLLLVDVAATAGVA